MVRLARVMVMLAAVCTGMEAIASFDSITVDNQVMATNGVISTKSGIPVQIDLFLPASSASSSFYKVFSRDELPVKE